MFGRPLPSRFTPAGAGIGTKGKRLPPSGAVHPRRCGDRIVEEKIVPIPSGSPPQVRGSGLVDHETAKRVRFTPAGAGIGRGESVWEPVLAVHPRRCGDRAVEQLEYVYAYGSPPQVRGSAARRAARSAGRRFTPAGAGIGSFRYVPNRAMPVHPRRCGDRNRLLVFILSLSGSPPQVRGSACDALPLR